MWQTENDLRNRIQELDSGTSDRYGRLFDTITETDGSARTGVPLVNRLMDRIRRAVRGMGSRSQPTMPESASMGHAK